MCLAVPPEDEGANGPGRPISVVERIEVLEREMATTRTAIHLRRLRDREGGVAGALFAWGLGLLSASNLTENGLDRAGHVMHAVSPMADAPRDLHDEIHLRTVLPAPSSHHYILNGALL